MSLPVAIIGLDPVQRDWLSAAADLRAAGEIEIVSVGHRAPAPARDIADAIGAADPTRAAPPAFDDLRTLLNETAPKVILLDRPTDAPLEFLLSCISQGIGILSLGPPVESFAEAQRLAEALEPRSHLLYIWPHFADAPAFRHCAEADKYVRPIRFVSGRWLGTHHALARGRGDSAAIEDAAGEGGLIVRSLCALAWDALSSMIRLLDLPNSVYAAIRGNAGADGGFADLSGAASVTLRFPEDAAANLVISDQSSIPAGGHKRDPRELLIWGSGGTLRLGTHAYEFHDAAGKLIDQGPAEKGPAAQEPPPAGGENSTNPRGQALRTLREFIRHYQLPPSPHRGWEHRLEDIAAALEAIVVSNRTGQAESPGRFRRHRR